MTVEYFSFSFCRVEIIIIFLFSISVPLYFTLKKLSLPCWIQSRHFKGNRFSFLLIVEYPKFSNTLEKMTLYFVWTLHYLIQSYLTITTNLHNIVNFVKEVMKLFTIYVLTFLSQLNQDFFVEGKVTLSSYLFLLCLPFILNHLHNSRIRKELQYQKKPVHLFTFEQT